MPIDYKRYPPNWKSYIVPTVLARAKNKCECCGLENFQEVWSVKFWIRDEKGKYTHKAIWFRAVEDAIRENTGQGMNSVRVVLTVAHLDHDETNDAVQLHRLKAMCQICHLRYDAKEKYRRSLKSWEAGHNQIEKI